MAITVVKSFDSRVKSHIDLCAFKDIVKCDIYKKNWGDMTPVQKLLHVLTLGLWRPGVGNTEKTEIHNFVTSLLIELNNHEKELQGRDSSEPVELHIADSVINCVIERKGFTLYDNTNRVFLSHKDRDVLQNATKILPGQLCYISNQSFQQPTPQGASEILSLMERLDDSVRRLPLNKVTQSEVELKELKGSLQGDIFRQFRPQSRTRLFIGGVSVPTRVIFDLLGWKASSGCALPDRLPTTLSRDQVKEVLSSVELNDSDRDKVISTLSAPGAFEMILTISGQGFVSTAESDLITCLGPDVVLASTGLVSWMNNSASSYGYNSSWNESVSFSLENHEGGCRAICQYLEITSLITEGKPYSFCKVKQVQLDSRPGEIKESMSSAEGDHDFIGLGLPFTVRNTVFRTCENEIVWSNDG